MMQMTSISPTNVINDGAANTQSLNQLGEDYTRFLTLLTAQISNQDPLSPMDSTQFVAQLAQMSQVEQAVQTNAQLEQLRGDLISLSTLSGLQMVGQEVSVVSPSIVLEDGNTQTFYRLGDGADSVSAQIVDPLGRVIRTIEGLPTDGNISHSLNWDGHDDQGNLVLDGIYGVTLTANDSSGNPIQQMVFRNAVVEEAYVQQGELLLSIGNEEIVAADSLLSFR